MNKKKLTGFVQTAVLALLFLAMLVQCALYVGFAEGFVDGGLPPFPESEIMLLGKDVHGSAFEGRYLFSPCFSGFITAQGEGVSTFADRNSSEEIWRHFTEVLENAPRGTSKKVTYSDSAEKQKYLDELYAPNEACYYVKLAEGVEFSVLSMLVSGTYSDIPDNPGFVISDMFLMCGANGEAYITAVDNGGSVLKIFPSKNIVFNNELIETYTNTETGSFEFVKFENNIREDLNGYFPAYRRSPLFGIVKKYEFSDYFTVSGNSADARDFMGIFGINSDNARFYTTSSGDHIYVEDSTRLRIEGDGTLEYLPYGGEDLSEILGEYVTSHGDFEEIAESAETIAGNIGEKLSDSCASLALDGITYADGKCTFRYSYSVDGIPVLSQAPALLLEFSDGRLTYAHAELSVFGYSGYVKPDMPQKIAYSLMSSEISSPIIYFGAQYTENLEGDNAGLYTVRWAVNTASDGKEAAE